VVGTRPNFIKIGPFIEALKSYRHVASILVHTGQHYDYELSKVFFKELHLPKPDYHLGVGSGSHATQTAKVMELLEPILLKEKPDVLVAVGDVNSSLAAAIVGAKLHIPIAHIDAGARSYEKHSPEEINRVVIDHISSFLFCNTKLDVENVRREGIRDGVYFVGDIRYDAFLTHMQVAQKKSRILRKFGLVPKGYHLATVHREENTNDPRRLRVIIEALSKLGNVVFLCHPRTESYLKKYGLWDTARKHLILTEPVGYLDMLWLEKNAFKILTDSGGVQREACWVKVPCITLMEITGATDTLKAGWNRTVEIDTAKILRAARSFRPHRAVPRLWGNGSAGKKIMRILVKSLSE